MFQFGQRCRQSAGQLVVVQKQLGDMAHIPVTRVADDAIPFTFTTFGPAPTHPVFPLIAAGGVIQTDQRFALTFGHLCPGLPENRAQH